MTLSKHEEELHGGDVGVIHPKVVTSDCDILLELLRSHGPVGGSCGILQRSRRDFVQRAIWWLQVYNVERESMINHL